MIVSFAMPGRDEQSALDERTDSYLAAKTSLNPSQSFWASCSFSFLQRTVKSFTFFPASQSLPLVSSVWKLHKKKPPFCYFIPKPSEVEIAWGNLSICYPSAQQWMEFITLCILPPASARQPVGWSMDGEGGSSLREGAIAFAALSAEAANLFITEWEGQS